METITFDWLTTVVIVLLAVAFIFFAVGFLVVNYQNKEFKSGNQNLHKMKDESERRYKERSVELLQQKGALEHLLQGYNQEQLEQELDRLKGEIGIAVVNGGDAAVLICLANAVKNSLKNLKEGRKIGYHIDE